MKLRVLLAMKETIDDKFILCDTLYALNNGNERSLSLLNFIEFHF